MRTSVFDKMGKDSLQRIVDESSSFLEVLKKAGLSIKGTGNYDTLRRYIHEWNINTIDLECRRKKQIGVVARKSNTVPLSDLLVISTKRIRGSSLKKKLLKEGIIKDVCSECGISPIWNNKPLVLQLEHKNGNCLDNRKENLTLLCPNCHSQTMTYGGKSKRKHLPHSVTVA